MSLDLVLVSAATPDEAALRAAVVAAADTGLLRDPQVTGDWEQSRVIGIVGPIGGVGQTAIFSAGFFRPSSRDRSWVKRTARDWGVSPPAGGSERMWWTEIALEISTHATDEQAVRELGVLTAVLAPVARSCGGFLVLLSGGPGAIVPLEGVPAPDPPAPDLLSAEGRDEQEPVPPPGSVVFTGGVYRGGAPGDGGWRRALAAVRLLTSAAPEIAPDYLFAHDEWQPLTDERATEAPDFWPLSQQLYAATGRFAWSVDGSYDHLDLAGRGPAPVDASPRLGRGLVDLAPTGLDYGYVHCWHPDEPWTGAVGPRMTGDGPWFALDGRSLAEGLPNLYWLQLLGPRWVAQLGRDRIASTPVYRVREIGPDHWLLQLTPSLGSVTADFEGFAAARAGGVAHLGIENFPHLRAR